MSNLSYCGITSKGPWRSSKTAGIQLALSNEYLKQVGLAKRWMDRSSLSQPESKLGVLNEPLCAELHAGWWGLEARQLRLPD